MYIDWGLWRQGEANNMGNHLFSTTLLQIIKADIPCKGNISGQSNAKSVFYACCNKSTLFPSAFLPNGINPGSVCLHVSLCVCVRLHVQTGLGNLLVLNAKEPKCSKLTMWGASGVLCKPGKIVAL